LKTENFAKLLWTFQNYSWTKILKVRKPVSRESCVVMVTMCLAKFSSLV